MAKVDLKSQQSRVRREAAVITFQVSFSNSLLPLSERVDRAPIMGVKSTLIARDGPVPGANHDRSRCRLALLITV